MFKTKKWLKIGILRDSLIKKACNISLESEENKNSRMLKNVRNLALRL